MQAAVVAKADLAFLGNMSDPSGLLTYPGVTDGGSVGTDLDALADAVVSIEAHGGTAFHIIAAPGVWGPLAKRKTGTGSTQSLLGAGTEAAERRLLGVPVLTSSAMPADTILVLDSRTVLTVHGQVILARSDDA